VTPTVELSRPAYSNRLKLITTQAMYFTGPWVQDPVVLAYDLTDITSQSILEGNHLTSLRRWVRMMASITTVMLWL
jgi:hypothetical protein